jgi:hypothetical protein
MVTTERPHSAIRGAARRLNCYGNTRARPAELGSAPQLG